ncbi:hypothetical protein HY768_11560 [candidate division TA06 bacterium]|uniref:Aminoglycoside phosphotransferase domain-containing protein n=1 Tax=candidate division TA06 bacterium TaxID=2250710 RepID=A0A933MJ55_UNCT6|nr:hypothetical protein [candidate division TA06 bacterium]
MNDVLAVVSYCFIKNSTGRIAVIKHKNNMVFPCFDYSVSPNGHTEKIPAEALRCCHIHTVVLKRLFNKYNKAKNTFIRAYLLDNIGGLGKTKSNLYWKNLDGIMGQKGIIPDVSTKQFARICAKATKNELCPWQNPGWHQKTQKYFIETLRKKEKVTGKIRVQQIKTWDLSCVLKAVTNKGSYFLKAIPAKYKFEASLSAFLSKFLPQYSLELVAIKLPENYLVSKEAQGKTLDQLHGTIRWEKALSDFALFQISLIPKTKELQRLGIPTWPKDTLEKTLFLPAGKYPGAKRMFKDADLRIMDAKIARLKKLYSQNRINTIPDTLEHGDFWAGQVFYNNGKTKFLDWSFATITNPFFSLICFFDHIKYYRKDIGKAAVLRLINAYLKPWEKYAAQNQLARYFALSQQVAILYYALVYKRIDTLKMLLE